MRRLLNRLFVCWWRGHSHPLFDCVYCGRRSPVGIDPETGRYFRR